MVDYVPRGTAEGAGLFTPERVVEAYRSGYFPMAESRVGPISWYSPDPRAIIPLSGFNVPEESPPGDEEVGLYDYGECAFERVIGECAEGRFPEETWISDDIVRVYTELHRLGVAHSVETWEEGRLVGGLYGVALGGAFFGESMFSRHAERIEIRACFARLQAQCEGIQAPRHADNERARTAVRRHRHSARPVPLLLDEALPIGVEFVDPG